MRKKKLRKVLYLTPEVWERCEHLAEELGISPSSAVELTLRRAFELTGHKDKRVEAVKEDKEKEAKFKIKL